MNEEEIQFGKQGVFESISEILETLPYRNVEEVNYAEYLELEDDPLFVFLQSTPFWQDNDSKNFAAQLDIPLIKEFLVNQKIQMLLIVEELDRVDHMVSENSGTDAIKSDFVSVNNDSKKTTTDNGSEDSTVESSASNRTIERMSTTSNVEQIETQSQQQTNVSAEFGQSPKIIIVKTFKYRTYTKISDLKLIDGSRLFYCFKQPKSIWSRLNFLDYVHTGYCQIGQHNSSASSLLNTVLLPILLNLTDSKILAYLPGAGVNDDQEGRSPGLRLRHCTAVRLKPAISPNWGTSGAEFVDAISEIRSQKPLVLYRNKMLINLEIASFLKEHDSHIVNLLLSSYKTVENDEFDEDRKLLIRQYYLVKDVTREYHRITEWISPKFYRLFELMFKSICSQITTINVTWLSNTFNEYVTESRIIIRNLELGCVRFNVAEKRIIDRMKLISRVRLFTLDLNIFQDGQLDEFSLMMIESQKVATACIFNIYEDIICLLRFQQLIFDYTVQQVIEEWNNKVLYSEKLFQDSLRICVKESLSSVAQLLTEKDGVPLINISLKIISSKRSGSIYQITTNPDLDHVREILQSFYYTHIKNTLLAIQRLTVVFNCTKFIKQSLYWSIQRSPDVIDQNDRIKRLWLLTVQEIENFLNDNWIDPYIYIWHGVISEFVKDSDSTILSVQTELEKFSDMYRLARRSFSLYRIHNVAIDCSSVKSFICNSCSSQIEKYGKYLVIIAEFNAKRIERFIEQATRKLNELPENADSLGDYENSFSKIRHACDAVKHSIWQLKLSVSILDKYEISMGKQLAIETTEIEEQFKTFLNTLHNTVVNLTNIKEAFIANAEKSQEAWKYTVTTFLKNFYIMWPCSNELQIGEAIELLAYWQRFISWAENEYTRQEHERGLLQLPILQENRKNLMTLTELVEKLSEFLPKRDHLRISLNTWNSTLLKDVDLNEMHIVCSEILKYLSTLTYDPIYEKWEIYDDTLQLAQEFKSTLPIIESLHSDKLRKRHWVQMQHQTGIGELNENIENKSVKDILNFNVVEHKMIIVDTADKAAREFDVEK
ncbi:hypothetical protein GJ496_002407, partial [Pomphorhynchus laevis]